MAGCNCSISISYVINILNFILTKMKREDVLLKLMAMDLGLKGLVEFDKLTPKVCIRKIE